MFYRALWEALGMRLICFNPQELSMIAGLVGGTERTKGGQVEPIGRNSENL
jgi:hypothetical protein